MEPNQTEINALPTVRMYAPETWGSVVRFTKFHEHTYPFPEKARRALRGVSGHFEKSQIFLSLAHQLSPGAEIDSEHLKKHGYTGLEHSKNLAAVIESVFIELYSSLDCARQVVAAIYKSNCRGFPDSTRKTFQKIKDGKLTGLPQAIEEAFKAANWYWELLRIRDALTHSDVGICKASLDSSSISYSHSGMSQDGAEFQMPDIFGRLDLFQIQVNAFLGAIFQYLYSQLKQEQVMQVCGIFWGRVYHRQVVPVSDLDFHSGICGTVGYENSDSGRRCPFAEDCGAFTRAKSVNTTT